MMFSVPKTILLATCMLPPISFPLAAPTTDPSSSPTVSESPTKTPSPTASSKPTITPSQYPTTSPSAEPTPEPTEETEEPTPEPTEETEEPTPEPTPEHTPEFWMQFIPDDVKKIINGEHDYHQPTGEDWYYDTNKDWLANLDENPWFPDDVYDEVWSWAKSQNETLTADIESLDIGDADDENSSSPTTNMAMAVGAMFAIAASGAIAELV